MRINWKHLNRDERIEIVRIGALKRMSASQIASEIENCTRNAVIGTAFRAGIHLKGKGRTRPPQEPAEQDILDWKSLSAEEKAEFVRDLAGRGYDSTEISQYCLRASPKAISSCANRNGIALVAKSSKENLKYGKDGRPIWSTMSPSRKVDFVLDLVVRGMSYRNIAYLAIGASTAAIKHVVYANKHQLALAAQRAPRRNRRASPPRASDDDLAPEWSEQEIAARGYVNILNMDSDQCHAPMWQDDRLNRQPEEWVYCGKPVQPDSSYCPECHAKFWEQPPNKMKVVRRQTYNGHGR